MRVVTVLACARRAVHVQVLCVVAVVGVQHDAVLFALRDEYLERGVVVAVVHLPVRIGVVFARELADLFSCLAIGQYMVSTLSLSINIQRLLLRLINFGQFSKCLYVSCVVQIRFLVCQAHLLH